MGRDSENMLKAIVCFLIAAAGVGLTDVVVEDSPFLSGFLPFAGHTLAICGCVAGAIYFIKWLGRNT